MGELTGWWREVGALRLRCQGERMKGEALVRCSKFAWCTFLDRSRRQRQTISLVQLQHFAPWSQCVRWMLCCRTR